VVDVVFSVAVGLLVAFVALTDALREIWIRFYCVVLLADFIIYGLFLSHPLSRRSESRGKLANKILDRTLFLLSPKAGISVDCWPLILIIGINVGIAQGGPSNSDGQ
jgi:hypothetical protein